MEITKGSYVAVGLGMMLGAHVSPRSRRRDLGKSITAGGVI